jgi:hypothetical protein
MKKLSFLSKSVAFMAIVSMSFVIGCSKEAPPEPKSQSELSGVSSQEQRATEPRVAGRTIQNLNVEGTIQEQAASFTGRIVDIDVTRVGDDILASGRLVGSLTQNGITQQINQVFTNVPINLLDQALELINLNQRPQVCPILFLELGPIFLDVLGLIVEVPDPIVVEVRAERGPGQLLGNLLCALLGILD